MNRKLLFNILVSICIITLTACTTAAPTTPALGSVPPTVSSNVSPTKSSNTDTSSALPTASNSGDSVGTSTLACSGGGQSAVTPELTEGPYFTANSPERADLLEEGVAGTKIIVTGYVYTTDCQPVANALLDFWQADGNGVYDNSGYTLRGHQYTDSSGHYQLTTVVPGIYPGRTEHIHVKAQAANGKLITSQLFFPGVTQNDSDGIYDQRLLLSIEKTSDGLQGQFNFVVPAP